MKLKEIFLLLVIFSGAIYSQQEIDDLLSIKFIDNLNGVTTGGKFNYGLILQTNDGGKSWQKVNNFSSRLIWKSEYFYNNYQLLFTFDSLYKYSNANYTALAYPVGFDLIDEYFLNNDVGWISGAGGLLYFTDDGGKTWIKQNINSLGAGLGSLFFLNRNSGWCSNNNNLFFTKDGGANWTMVENTSSTKSIFFIDSLIGYRVTSQFVYKSFDGGLNWEILNVSSHKIFNAIYTLSHLECFITASSNGNASVFNSHDGGENWTEFVLENINRVSTRAITFSDSLTGWISCNNGIIYKTIDAGNKWFELNTGITHIVDESQKIKSYKLFNNYPNPFNPSTKIKYRIAKNGNVKIYLYDILGREINKLIDEYNEQGEYVIDFHANNLSNGIYLYKIISSDYSETKKMLLIK